MYFPLLFSPLHPVEDCTYRTLVDGGMSADAGALSSPRLEQLTTQDGWSPASTQLQLTGQGPQLLLTSAPHASRQQSPTSRVQKKLNLGTQTPCFRLNKVWPFPQGIAHSHRIASDGASPLSPGGNTTQHKGNTRVLLSCEERTFTAIPPAFHRFLFSWSDPLPLKI